MRALPFAGRRASHSVLSVQSIEHVPDPERVLAEVARVLEPDGVAVFVTPEPADARAGPTRSSTRTTTSSSTPAELRALCARWFGDVAVRGLFGSPRYMELFDAERAHARPAAPARPAAAAAGWSRTARRRRLYDLLLRRDRATRTTRARRRSSPEDFELRDDGLGAALDVVAVCTDPIAAVTRDLRLVRRPRSTGPPSGCTGRIRCAALRRRDDRSVALRRRSWRAPTATGTARRPAAASAFVGDALLRPHARPARRPARRDRAARPGARRGRRRRHAASTPCARTGREAVGLEREAAPPRRPRRAARGRSSGEWAAVVFWHSLEHLPEPGRRDRATPRGCSRPAACSSSRCPNAGSLQARVFGDRWLHLDPPRHLVHLTPRALLGRARARRAARSSGSRARAAGRS